MTTSLVPRLLVDAGARGRMTGLKPPRVWRSHVYDFDACGMIPASRGSLRARLPTSHPSLVTWYALLITSS